MKLFFNKLWWLFLTLLGYFILCFILELPMTTAVYSLLDGEDPKLLTTATFSVGFVAMLYLIYLKRLRNDSRRREYLTEVHRQYGSFGQDCLYILNNQEYRMEVFAFAVAAFGFAVYWCIIPFKEGQSNPWITALWILVCLILWLLAIGIFSVGRLLIHNRVHRAWVDGLIVPELTEEAQELQQKHRAIKRNLIIQFIFSLSFYIIWALNHYLVTFSVVVTPALFLYSHIQSLIGILHMRDLEEPYRWYARFHCIALAFYIFSLTFGVFSPK